MFQWLWEEILPSAIISAMLVGALIFLCRSWVIERVKGSVQTAYAKTLVSYTEEIKRQNALEVERAKGAIQAENSEKFASYSEQLKQRNSSDLEQLKFQLSSQADRAKSAIQAEYAEKLASHTEDLKRRSAIEAEHLRSQLSVQAAQQSLKFAGLHEERARVIAETYALLGRFHRAMADYTKAFEPVGGKPKHERREVAMETHKAFIAYYSEKKLYLPKNCVALLDAINETGAEVFYSFLYEIELSPVGHAPVTRWHELTSKVRGPMNEAIDELENAFRRILGDDQ